MIIISYLPPESNIVKLMTFLKNTPSPEGTVSKAEGVGRNSSRVSHSSPSSATPSAMNITSTVVLGVAKEICRVSVSIEKSAVAG